MTDRQREQTKARFITEYRALCDKYDLVVTTIDDADGDVLFCAAKPDDTFLEQQVIELLYSKVVLTSRI